MKKVIYLSFYFEPDLCAGSFRNSSLAKTLASQGLKDNIKIELYTTFPNRYNSYLTETQSFQKIENLEIHRIKTPSHNSGILDQIRSFTQFYVQVRKKTKSVKPDLVFASSSRLFTAYLGYKIAKKNNALLYLDIRDIFVDTISDLYKNSILRLPLILFLKRIERSVFEYAKHINLISPGFKNYFTRYKKSKITYYTNGIDEAFLNRRLNQSETKRFKKSKNVLRIIYAGNIGEGQGLHHIIPQAAKALGPSYEFNIYGDGGAKIKLVDRLQEFGNLPNIKIFNPVSREELYNIYEQADYLFIHLNDIPAFEKVLPSKVFELATFPKPIIAGVEGYAREFIESEVSDSIVFTPCCANEFVDKLKKTNFNTSINRNSFIQKFQRSNINQELSRSILNYL